MLDELGKVAWYVSPVAAIAVFALTMMSFRNKTRAGRILAATCFGLASALALAIFALSVLFRDGLAPGFIPSHGTTALIRTADGLSGLVLLLPLLGLGWWASRAPKSAPHDGGAG